MGEQVEQGAVEGEGGQVALAQLGDGNLGNERGVRVLLGVAVVEAVAS